MRKLKKGLRCVGSAGLAAAVALSMVPVGSAFGLGSLQSWEHPTAKSSLTTTQGGATKTYITSASHKASEGLADMLGISNVTATPFAANPFNYQGTADEIYYGVDKADGTHTAGVSETARFGIFGSDVNENPNPFYANYFYNAYQNTVGSTDLADAKSTLLLDTTSGNPFVADTNVIDAYGTSAALYYRPDILLAAGASPKSTDIKNKTTGEVVYYGDALTTTSGYDALVEKIRNKQLGSYEGQDLYVAGDENYDPYYVTFAMGTYANCIRTTYAMADAADAVMARDSSKTTRYNDPAEIAEDFEGYLLGTQDAVLKAIDEGKVTRKTVAVVSAVDTATNTVTLLTSDTTQDSATVITGALKNVTDNMADKLGTTTVTAQQLMQADDIYIASYMGMSSDATAAEKLQDELVTVLKAGGYKNESTYPEIFVQGPKTVIHAKEGANDGVAYIGAVIGFAYPTVIDPIDATAYYYQNFYHVKESRLADAMGLNMASMSLPSGYVLSLSNYSESAYEAVVNEGLAYYGANKATIDSQYPTLTATDRLTIPTAKADQNLKVTAKKTVTVKAGKTVKAITKVSGAKGAVSYKKVSGSKKLTVNAKTGKLAVKKGTKKGTYTVKVKISAKATSDYKAASKTVTIKVKVK